MRTLVIAAATAATLAMAPAAHAAPDGISGSCTYDRVTGTTAGYAYAPGATSTSVTCTVRTGTTVVGRYSESMPGSLVVVTGSSVVPIFPTQICWQGSAFFATSGTFAAAGPFCRSI